MPLFCCFLICLFTSLGLHRAQALEIDWSGQFWSDVNLIWNNNQAPSELGGNLDRYSLGFENNNWLFYGSLFSRLKPQVIVNDNIHLYSELWLGHPTLGLFGSSLPYSRAQRNFLASGSRGFPVSAQRVYADLLTGLGTIQLGRVPVHWGLGLLWNSGDHLFDRAPSTRDGVRWFAQFGSVYLVPSVFFPSMGSSLGGDGLVNSSTGVYSPVAGRSKALEVSLILKYTSEEDDLDLGVNYMRLMASPSQEAGNSILTPEGSSTYKSGRILLNTYDIFFRKKLAQWVFSLEVPIFDGQIADISYQSFNIGSEIKWKAMESADFSLRFGFVQGQSGVQSFDDLKSFQAASFHPNYKVANILFSNNLLQMTRPQSLNNVHLSPDELQSPFDDGINNSIYTSLSSRIRLGERWALKPNLVSAFAANTAQNGQYYYHSGQQTFSGKRASYTQSSFMGVELDLGVSYQWDEDSIIQLDTSFLLPGDYYAFSNTAKQFSTGLVWATGIKLGIQF